MAEAQKRAKLKKYNTTKVIQSLSSETAKSWPAPLSTVTP
jgi:hypothetical protein